MSGLPIGTHVVPTLPKSKRGFTLSFNMSSSYPMDIIHSTWVFLSHLILTCYTFTAILGGNGVGCVLQNLASLPLHTLIIGLTAPQLPRSFRKQKVQSSKTHFREPMKEVFWCLPFSSKWNFSCFKKCCSLFFVNCYFCKFLQKSKINNNIHCIGVTLIKNVFPSNKSRFY